MKLKEFVQQREFVRQRRVTCKTCLLPKTLLSEVAEGIDLGVGSRTIANWLGTKGHSFSKSAIDEHRRNHHKKGSR